IPDRATTVVVLASVGVVGEPLDVSLVHRPERVAALAGIELGDELTPADVAAVLASPRGGLKHVPSDTDVAVVLNKADTPGSRETGRAVVEAVLDRSERVSRGLVTSFRTDTCLAVG
ncbi:MAG: selenium cofactor biosynthesis protein YqeC, partial [Halobacteriota archaeon]